jgi:dephospho-CoA kinase
MRRRRTKLVVMDVPLLFESGREQRYDAVIVVSAPEFLRRARVLARPGMTPARLAAIMAKQMPDAEKRRRADIVVPSGLGRALTWRRLRDAIERLGHRAAIG